jgi:hypothetical protein
MGPIHACISSEFLASSKFPNIVIPGQKRSTLVDWGSASLHIYELLELLIDGEMD